MTRVINSRTYTIAPLYATNYSTWSIKLEMLLIRFKIWSVVDGLEVFLAATDVTTLAAWKLKDSKARFEILLYCREKQLLLLKPLSTSKAMTNKLKL